MISGASLMGGGLKANPDAPDFPDSALISQARLALLRPAHHTGEANGAGDHAPDQHPDGFVRRRASEEPGDVRVKGIGRLNPEDDERDSADEQSQRNDFVHEEFVGLFSSCQFRSFHVAGSDAFPSRDEIDEHHDDGDHQEHVD
jgi:hypothetical protein